MREEHRLTARKPRKQSSLERALRLALKAWGESQHCDPQSGVRDLLVDIRHVCDAEGIDFHQALDTSYQVYVEERE